MKIAKYFSLLLMCFFVGCATVETHNTVTPQTVRVLKTRSVAQKHKVSIGKFENRSRYLNGVFSSSKDNLGMQARQILKNHLSQSGGFTVLDRANLEEMEREKKFNRYESSFTGGDYIITGAVTEFGRKETGTRALGGVIGKSKKQTAYGKVSISLVDVKTSTVVISVQGAGEYHLSNEEVLGFGSQAGFDPTLTDKVLNLAIIEAVNQLLDTLEE
jgi:curli biogenesis system outer membrane secretion channel CsgG